MNKLEKAMKKFLIGMLIGAPLFAMTACSSDSDPSSTDAIEVRAITNIRHKASEITTSDLTEFRVYAYNTTDAVVNGADAPSFMYGVNVSRPAGGSTSWSYAPVKYWPTDGSFLSFYAYAPLTDDLTFIPESSTTSGLPEFKYTSPANVTDQVDVIYAKAEGLTRDSNGGSPVLMDFYHALSQVIFVAQGGKESVKFNVSRLELFGLVYSGQFSYESERWTTLDTEKTYYAIDLTDGTGAGKDVIAGEWTELTSSAENTALMALPQVLVPGAATDVQNATGLNPQDGNAYLRITFGAVDVESGAVLVPDGYTYIVPFSMDIANNELAAGMRYRIQLTLNGTTNGGSAEEGEAPTDPGYGELNAIEFDVIVNDFIDWVDVHITL